MKRIYLFGIGISILASDPWAWAVTMSDVEERAILPSNLAPVMDPMLHGAGFSTRLALTESPLTLRLTYDQEGNLRATADWRWENVAWVVPVAVTGLPGIGSPISDIWGMVSRHKFGDNEACLGFWLEIRGILDSHRPLHETDATGQLLLPSPHVGR